MERKIYNKLIEWKLKSHGRTALMIEGARRIGKSYIVAEFAKNEYAHHLIIDFASAPKEIHLLFENHLDRLDQLFEKLKLYYNVRLEVRKSLIVFDEVQFCPKARSAIKYLVADGRYDYIETGSLISIKKNVKDILIPSEETMMEMFPMDFEEFLWANGEEGLMTYIKQQFAAKKPMGDLLHRKTMEYFRQYMTVGGMPQAVAEFVESHDYDEVDFIKRNILALYQNDIRKYGDGEETKICAIFEEIPGQLQRHERKFRLSEISETARMRDYSQAFFWLKDSKIINCCYNSTAPNIGLRMNEDRTTLKCYLGDTGLLVSMAFDEGGDEMKELYKKLALGTLETNMGMIVENVVAQMLRAAGHKLYFYSKYDQKAEERMEIDFLTAKSKISSRHNINPIEVKSGPRYSINSLRKCIAKYSNFISTPYVLHEKDLKEEDGILYLPLYMTSLL